jgi:hypothetical protein
MSESISSILCGVLMVLNGSGTSDQGPEGQKPEGGGRAEM